MTPKESKLWLDIIRGFRCAHCGLGGKTDAHHVWNAGMSRKCSDSATIPLCRGCHHEHHATGKPSREWCAAKLRFFWRQVGVHPDVKGMGERRQREVEQKAWEEAVSLLLKRVGTKTYVIGDYVRDFWR